MILDETLRPPDFDRKKYQPSLLELQKADLWLLWHHEISLLKDCFYACFRVKSAVEIWAGPPLIDVTTTTLRRPQTLLRLCIFSTAVTFAAKEERGFCIFSLSPQIDGLADFITILKLISLDKKQVPRNNTAEKNSSKDMKFWDLFFCWWEFGSKFC